MRVRDIRLNCVSIGSGAAQILALQLWFLLKMKLLCEGLMCTPPERPCDDVGRIDASSREALRYASNISWIAAIMAKPSMTSET